MKYREGFDEIMERMHLPENSERYNQLNICPCNLQGDKKRLHDAVKKLLELTTKLENNENQEMDIVSPQRQSKHWYDLRNEVLELLDKLGWKQSH